MGGRTRSFTGLKRRQLLAGIGASALASSVGCERERVPEGRISASLWFTYGGKNREVLEQLVKRFNESQRRYFIRAVFQGDYYEGLAKLRTAIAADAGPTFSHVIGEVVPYLAEAGVLENLKDYPGASELDIVPALGQEGSWIGGGDRPLVALPFNRSTPIAYLNRDVFDRHGLSAPQTWNELRASARALTLRQDGRIVRHGFGCPISWWFWVAMVGQAGATVVEADGTATLGAQAGIEALQFWQRLVHEDGSMKPPPGRDYNAWEQTNQDFLAGRTAMTWTSTAFLKYLEDNAPFRVRAAPLPRFRRYAVPTGGTHWILLRSAPGHEKRAAWAFLRFMHEPQQAIFWATSTGYMPVVQSAIRLLEEQGYYREHPNDRVAVDQLKVAFPWPWSEDLFRIQREIVQPRLERAVLEQASAEQVMHQAQRLAARRR